MKYAYQALSINLCICAGILVLWLGLFRESLESYFPLSEIPEISDRLAFGYVAAIFCAAFPIFISLRDRGLIYQFSEFIFSTRFGRIVIVSVGLWAPAWTLYASAYLGRHRSECLFNCGYKWHLDEWFYWMTGLETPLIVVFFSYAIAPTARIILSWIKAAT